MPKRALLLLLASTALLAPELSRAAPHAGLALVAPSPVASETRAWTVAKGALPAGLTALVGVNGKELRSTQLFQKLYPLLLADKSARKGVEQLKTLCNIDLVASVDSAVFGLQAHEKGVLVVALRDIDQAAVTSCIGKLAAADERPEKVTSKQQGNIVEYGGNRESAKLYMSWLAKDVVAITTDPNDKALLKKLTSGGVRGDAIGKTAATMKTDSALWAITTRSEQFPELAQAKVNKAYGSANFVAGYVETNAHVLVDNPAQANAAAEGLLARLADLRQNPLAGGLLKNIKISASGREVLATGTFAESDLISLSGLLLGSAR